MEEKAKESQNEEVKEEKKSSEVLKTLLKIILGIILILLGLWAVIGWWADLLAVIRGCIGLFLIMAGAIAIAIAKE